MGRDIRSAAPAISENQVAAPVSLRFFRAVSRGARDSRNCDDRSPITTLSLTICHVTVQRFAKTNVERGGVFTSSRKLSVSVKWTRTEIQRPPNRICILPLHHDDFSLITNASSLVCVIHVSSTSKCCDNVALGSIVGVVRLQGTCPWNANNTE